VAEGACLPGAAEQFHGDFYDFLREGLWGLYTLGEEVPRDNSIFLLAEGIISVLIVALAC
jgi:arabinogalactan oligomer/maltooligosaccharide transport system permease protein